MGSSTLSHPPLDHPPLDGESDANPTNLSVFSISRAPCPQRDTAESGFRGTMYDRHPPPYEARGVTAMSQEHQSEPFLAEPSMPLEIQPSDPSASSGKKKLSTETLMSWWWWWEITASLLSITSLILLVVFLSTTNGTPLRSWSLPIQPNSLIAVLTTTSKTTMMAPVTACLSQLKWSHFLRRSWPLDQFQAIDDASRGPWGSFRLLVRGNEIRAVLPIFLALITVVGIGFEPSAQQILDFPERNALLTNVTAGLGTATEYVSKSYAFDADLRYPLRQYHLQSSINEGIFGNVFRAEFNCPGDYCVWDDFTTLGFCSEYQNVTSKTKIRCGPPDQPTFNSTYDFPDGQGSTIAREVTFANKSYSSSYDPNTDAHFRMWFQPNFYRQNLSAILSAVKVTHHDANQIFPHRDTDSYFVRFYVCAYTFRNITADPRRLFVDPVTTEELLVIDPSQDVEYAVFRSPLTSATYSVHSWSAISLFGYLQGLLTRTAYSALGGTGNLDEPPLRFQREA